MFMYSYVFICIHTYIYTCIHFYIYTIMFIQIYMHTYIHEHTQSHIHVNIHTHKHAHAHAHLHVCTFPHLYTCIHASIHPSFQHPSTHTYMFKHLRHIIYIGESIQGSHVFRNRPEVFAPLPGKKPSSCRNRERLGGSTGGHCLKLHASIVQFMLYSIVYN